MYEMLVLDLDGTTLNNNHSISKKNIEGIRRCKDLGIKVIVASGRSDKSLHQYIKKLDIQEYYHISNNGGMIFHLNGEKMNIPSMDKELVEHIRDNLERLNIEFTCSNADGIYYTKKGSILVQEMCSHGEDPPQYVSNIDKVDGIFKYVTYCDSEEKYERVKELNIKGMKVFRTSHHFVEIMSNDINKYTAISSLVQKYGVPNDKIIAIGDSENDIPMLSGVGFGIAMANAKDEIKSASKHVSPWTNEENGVAKIISKYILNEDL